MRSWSRDLELWYKGFTMHWPKQDSPPPPPLTVAQMFAREILPKPVSTNSLVLTSSRLLVVVLVPLNGLATHLACQYHEVRFVLLTDTCPQVDRVFHLKQGDAEETGGDAEANGRSNVPSSSSHVLVGASCVQQVVKGLLVKRNTLNLRHLLATVKCSLLCVC